MPFYDQHLHSWNSFDSQTPPEKNVEQAIKTGLDGITFTEHFDTHEEEWADCVYDDDKITSEIDAVRDKYGGEIFIGKGIEVCYQPHRMEFILDFLSRHQFDVVLLSVHWAEGKPVHVPEHFVDVPVDLYIEQYLKTVKQATLDVLEMKNGGFQPFNILGHLDFAKRYTQRLYGVEKSVEGSVLVDEILSNCLAADLIPEVNTSPLRNDSPEPMPGPSVIKRYAELGGTMMPLGSDAHSAEFVGSHFGTVAKILQKAGITHQAVFKNGQVLAKPLNDD